MNPSAHRAFLEEVDRDIARLQAVRDYHASKMGVSKHEDNGQNSVSTVPSNTSPGRFKSSGQRDAAYAILSEAKGALKSKAIAVAMVANGYPSKPEKLGKLANALYTMMKRNPGQFKKVGTGLWTVKAQESDAT